MVRTIRATEQDQKEENVVLFWLSGPLGYDNIHSYCSTASLAQAGDTFLPQTKRGGRERQNKIQDMFISKDRGMAGGLR